MAGRFLKFTGEVEAADLTVSGYGFKYVELSDTDAARILKQASAYKVAMVKTERYSHEEYGSYDEVVDSMDYELVDMLSLKEKIWTNEQGCGDIIVDDGNFFGVVFFTGFTDYRGLEELGFIPFDHKDSRNGLTRFCCVEFGILAPNGVDLPEAYRQTEECESPSGRSSTSWKTTYRLEKK